MTQATVIPARRYVHTQSGRTASLTGAAPWTSDADAANWTIETAGFSISWPDGTRGAMRPPFTTAAEAQAFIDARPAGFQGFARFGD